MGNLSLTVDTSQESTANEWFNMRGKILYLQANLILILHNEVFADFPKISDHCLKILKKLSESQWNVSEH